MNIIFLTGKGSLAGAYCLNRLSSFSESVYVIIGGENPPTVWEHLSKNGIIWVINHILLRILKDNRRQTKPLNRLDAEEIAKEKGMPIYRIEKKIDIADIEKFKKIKPDLIISCFNPLYLPEDMVKLAKIACVNIHPALLPKYAGANPYFSVLRNGESETGITSHHITEKIDCGDIISQIKINIPTNWGIADLMDKIAISAPDVIDKIIEYARNNNFPRIKQDLSQRTWFDYLSDNDLFLNINGTIEAAYNLSRACPISNPPILKLNNREIRIWKMIFPAFQNPQTLLYPLFVIGILHPKYIWIGGGMKINFRDGHVYLKIISIDKGLMMPAWLFAKLRGKKKALC